MHCCSLSHLPESSLRASARAVHADERRNTAVALAHLGEIAARGSFRDWGYSTLTDYAVAELNLSRQAAYTRLRVAKTARRFTVIFEDLIQGRLEIIGVRLLGPKLTKENANELLAAARGKTKDEIKELIANWFPRIDVPSEIRPIAQGLTVVPEPLSGICHAAAPAPGNTPATAEATPFAPAAVPEERTSAPSTTNQLEPLSADSYGMHVTVSRRAREHVARLADLLSHQIAPHDLGRLVERAFELAVGVTEKQKYAATDRPRAPRGSNNPRYIPAYVRRAVRQRDGDRCAFVSDDGRRCYATSHLEFDHIVPVARGGQSTVANVQLLCRAHNQLMAERTYGAQFMQGKRAAAGAAAVVPAQEASDQRRPIAENAAQDHAEPERAEQERAEQERAEQERAEQERTEQERAEQERAEQERAEQERAEPERAEQARAEQERREAEIRAAEAERIAEENRAAENARARIKEDSASLASGLRRLGYRADQANAAAAYSEDLPNASLEERMKKSLSYFALKGIRARFVPAVAAAAS